MTKTILGNEAGLTVPDIVRQADIPRELIPVFESLRVECFQVAQKVYDNRVVGYNVDHPPYEEQVYGPVSLASEVFKRARRLAALLSPVRSDPLRPEDINRMLDICVDTVNYLTWTYALLVLATGFGGHEDSDDAPDYVGANRRKETPDGNPKSERTATSKQRGNGDPSR